MFYLNVLTGTTSQGLMWTLLTIGLFISFRILKFPDLTTEGSLPLGAVVTVVLINGGVNPIVSMIIAALFGAMVGITTGTLATYLKIQPILAGILTMTALFSITFRVLGGRSTVAISGASLVNSLSFITLNRRYEAILVGIFITAISIVFLVWFFSTKVGYAIRATGSNPKMATASAINTNRTLIGTLALSNAFIAISGGMIAQFEFGSAIVTIGQGSIVIGLASVIIGEKIFFRKRNSIFFKLIAVSFGAIVYRCIVAFALIIPMLEATDLRLITAILVVLTLCFPALKRRKSKMMV